MMLRIRTIARLTGIREATLRAWERRYGFPRPMRSEGNNYRVYSREEVEAIRRVARLIELDGLAVSEAIAQVVASPVKTMPRAERHQERFWAAVMLLDGDEVSRVLDEAQEAMDVDTYCDGFLMPLLREMSARLDVAREHLASGYVRQRLRQVLSSLESTANGPRALLACLAGDFHEGGLLGLGVQLKRKGWRVTMLGADTPADALRAACEQLHPDMVALSFVQRRETDEFATLLSDALRACAPSPVVVGGPGAREHLKTTFTLGAQYAESSQELIALWSQVRTAQSRP
ncbi:MULTISPECIES: cobalamin-dependent protein [Myxococcus]|uniref:MerR family transcriptional regulator n=1 Tax=Myxococcus llanfairpwllgwyngyllgogerychwyrndrobwllllantysiliogogogochensis TaxID=2590453 RepID=A0A540WNV0_9BACT|nr:MULTISPECIES: MerR family transcriptional regulator [Myxococcus]NTX06262.1 cobalamin B12-binding domain-containing protein [Myxococcus sp. CA040A]TQF10517.1 MerR family transcriptional regulator [Myxococcus llanfairpwllgwyngyllgogerychwyrndrobwllllantysiliogogogochensis]